MVHIVTLHSIQDLKRIETKGTQSGYCVFTEHELTLVQKFPHDVALIINNYIGTIDINETKRVNY